MNVGDIVQIDPANKVFGGCLAVVSELKHPAGRIMAYIQNAGELGQAYIFLNADDYTATGGRAVWMVE